METFSEFLLPIVVLLQIISRVSCVNLPSGMPQGMYCEGCIATVTELSKKVNKPSLDSREVRVIEALEKICDYQNFDTYMYSPPKTAQACSYLMDNFDEQIEEIAFKTDDVKVFEEQLCYKITQACEGIDRNSEQHKSEMNKIEYETPEGAIPFGQEPPEGEEEEPQEGEEEEPQEGDEEPQEGENEEMPSTRDKSKGDKEEDDWDYYPPEPEKGELPDNVTPAGNFPGAKPVDRSEL